jgi:hypothetical protein
MVVELGIRSAGERDGDRSIDSGVDSAQQICERVVAETLRGFTPRRDDGRDFSPGSERASYAILRTAMGRVRDFGGICCRVECPDP